MEVTKKLIKESFPYGARVVRNGSSDVVRLADIEVVNEDKKQYLHGWVWENKSITFEVRNVQVREDGSWLMDTPRGVTRLTPLTKEEGKDHRKELAA